MIVDPTDSKPAKFVWQHDENGNYVRVSRRTGRVFNKKKGPRPARPAIQYKDTDPDSVLLQTFDESTLNPLLSVSWSHKTIQRPESKPAISYLNPKPTI